MLVRLVYQRILRTIEAFFHVIESAQQIPQTPSNAPSSIAGSPPLDPRLRRNIGPSSSFGGAAPPSVVGSALPGDAQRNGGVIGSGRQQLLSPAHQRPPSPPADTTSGRFSPPPIIPAAPPLPQPNSTEDLKRSLARRRPTSPPQGTLPCSFAGLSSPEYKIGANTSGDSLQQRIGECLLLCDRSGVDSRLTSQKKNIS